ncbi:D-alanine--D-alanine ligase family protein [Poriferisphaera corsica]|uniref:D-alanine--D-alanine ligase family protein n=1 Tax=Poriferisphaera corsica TaxID=2528020 RepID=UPI00190C5546|nr:D-alanine--D-alanine ligase [Poriferisphaera corsica]
MTTPAPNQNSLKIIVLAGGPDAEREVSLQSGSQVAAALQTAGHHVTTLDISPDNLTAIDIFHQQQADLIFPVLHGKFGEGGQLQQILESHNLPFVGSHSLASRICIDKQQTKLILQQHNLPTPAFEVLTPDQSPTIPAPVVVKPVDEGSSIDLLICKTQTQLTDALAQLHTKHHRLMVEQFIPGRELTVGIIPSPPCSSDVYCNSALESARKNNTKEQGGYLPLPILEIIPATDFYDYQAKYIRDDTTYTFDVGLTPEQTTHIQSLALRAHHELGARHLSRVDFILADDGTPHILEINTMPGFTSHSLLPMAANHIGLSLPHLTSLIAHTTLQTHHTIDTSSEYVDKN